VAKLFGYSVDPEFDAAKEERQSKVNRIFVVAGILGIVYDAAKLPFAVEIFQILLSTVICYGVTFYVTRKSLGSGKQFY